MSCLLISWIIFKACLGDFVTTNLYYQSLPKFPNYYLQKWWMRLEIIKWFLNFCYLTTQT
jgi:hypothetical protein